MRCPRCTVHVVHEALECPGCHYSLAQACETYGHAPVKLSRLHDAASCLRKRDRDMVLRVMDQLEERFPQLYFCAYLGELAEGANLREMGFWLLNHASICADDLDRSNENTILLVIDLQERRAALIMGYFMEVLFDDVAAQRCLRSVRPYFLNGDYGVAIAACLRKIGRSLSRKARALRKTPENQGASVVKAFASSAPGRLKSQRSIESEANISGL